jgi:hypothetical protein
MGKIRLATTLRDIAVDLSLGNGTPEQVSALYEAISMIEKPYKWAKVQDNREELRRMSRQLDAISTVCQKMADKLADFTVDAPTGPYLEATLNSRREGENLLWDAFDSILHPSYYERISRNDA